MSYLMDLIRRRHSVRSFTDKPIPRADIDACLKAARLAPSGENTQPWRFIVADDPEYRTTLADNATGGIYRPTRFIKKAPVIIAVLAKKSFIVHKLGSALQGTQFYLLDIGMACEHLVLQAQELGIGSCYIGWFHSKKAAKALGVKKSDRVVMLIALGYPEKPILRKHKRHPLDDIVRYNEPF